MIFRHIVSRDFFLLRLINTYIYLFTEQFLVDSICGGFINNTCKDTQMKARNIAHANQLSADLCACKPVASCLLTEHASPAAIVLFIELWQMPQLIYKRIGSTGSAYLWTNKKLSCRRGTARRFVSLNILLNHSKSLKVIRNDTVEHGVFKLLIITSLTLCMYLVPFLRYPASKNGVTLKLGAGGRSRSLKMAPFDRSYTTFYWLAIVSIALYCTKFFK